MERYNVKIKGVTPLLFNRFIEASIVSKTKRRPGSTKDIDPKEKLYLDKKGKIYTPSTHIRGMLINAGKSFKIVGKGKATYSKLIGSSIAVLPEMLIHETQKWNTFSISAVNPNTKGRMMTHRPKLDKWSITFDLIFNEEDMPMEVIKQILDHGGQYVGIGDWRPDKKGQYGKFIVEKFEEVGE